MMEITFADSGARLRAFSVNPRFHRLGLLVGKEVLTALERSRVIVFGLGGVGSWAAEALVRSGIGAITIVDNDSVCITNINRQVQALENSVGLPKAAVLRERLLEINPDCDVFAVNRIFSKESAGFFEIEKYDYAIDAIDSLTHKLDLIELVVSLKAGALRGEGTDCAGCEPSNTSRSASAPLRGEAENARVRSEGGGFPPQIELFSSMGMALKLDPARLKTADIWETKGCSLARLVRQGLRKRGFSGHFTAVYSDEHITGAEDVEVLCGTEKCFCSNRESEWCSSKKVINGSAVTVTAAAGMILASLVIRNLTARVHGLESGRSMRRAAFNGAPDGNGNCRGG